MKEVNILARSQILIGVAYNVRAWDDTVTRVRVVEKDEDSVVLEYENDRVIKVVAEGDDSSILERLESNVVNRVPIDYFRDELEASMVSRPLPKRVDYLRRRFRMVDVEELRNAS